MLNILHNKKCAAMLGALILSPAAFGQTSGSLSITAKLADTGDGPEHWTVVWVTNATTGAFVRTLRREGNEGGYNSHWNDHCASWYSAVAGDPVKYTPPAAPDGYTGATANSYAAPVTQTWNCKDAKGATVPDGDYRIWIQYSDYDERNQGPVTTPIVFTKGATASTLNPPNQGSNFTGMKIVWTPGAVVATEPDIAVQQPAGSNLVDGSAKKSFGTVKIGKSGKAKTFTIKNTGNATLTGIVVKKSGSQAKDFVVTGAGATSLAPGAKTTFKVTFKPTAKGTRSAAVKVKSNDPNENPFDIKISGMGAK